MTVFIWIGAAVLFIFLAGIRIVRPTHRGLIERLGKYNRFGMPGFNWVIPVIEQMRQINITEMMVDAAPQEIITNDNLNARVDAQVYFRVKEDETSVKASQYHVNNFQWQIVNLARTTLRNIIGTLTLKSANSERGKINDELLKTLSSETARWGIDIVRTELKEIDPPKDVQETMNKVVKAENEKIAAVDFATARETTADGEGLGRDQAGRGRPSGQDPRGRGRGRGHSPGQRGRREIFRRQRPGPAPAPGARDGPPGQRQDHRSVGQGPGQRRGRDGRHHPAQEVDPEGPGFTHRVDPGLSCFSRCRRAGSSPRGSCPRG